MGPRDSSAESNQFGADQMLILVPVPVGSISTSDNPELAQSESKRTMSKVFNISKTSKPATSSPKTHSPRQVATERKKALNDCKTKVARISQECRSRNRKFRDIEFDLENDRDRCLHGLHAPSAPAKYNPSDVQRVTEIFKNPQFFVNGADSNDIIQGRLGDCWFLSALATISTAEGLVEEFCAARDPEVGVYGFIFFRDSVWVTVVIDDMLFTNIPKFEELSSLEKELYHNDRERYNKSARKSGKGLFFARSGTQGETWVPLIEKAYAKLHGDYQAINAGYASEATEDLTGGVSSVIPSRDILDPDRFWREELLMARKDRLFGCHFDTLDVSRSGSYEPLRTNGLIGGHAYSILRAVEHEGRRFLVIRNPWGNSEWTGPWSDGSKEWNQTGSPKLMSILGHVFGDDGQFVMEYSHFLEYWRQIDRTRLFDDTWVMSSLWLRVVARPLRSSWSHGDVSFTITMADPSLAVIVLSKLDDRYFQGIAEDSDFIWSFDFILFKRGSEIPVAESTHSPDHGRSTNLEVELEAGEYVLHVRLDRHVTPLPSDSWDERKYSRVLTERAKSQSIATNYKAKGVKIAHLPISPTIIAGRDLSEVETAVSTIEKLAKDSARAELGRILDLDKQQLVNKLQNGDARAEQVAKTIDEKAPGTPQEEGDADTETTAGAEVSGGRDRDREILDGVGSEADDRDPQDEDYVFLGLRVYTKQSAPAVIGGQLRQRRDFTNFSDPDLTIKL
ncbi:hypothetical protein BD779DRAFT_1232292 [Infundibulicybe gibba]|nr:hypothetical protein BD779DRAFT_1232292 [Infundibulicybe gibba]